ncbi:MAG: TIGR03617 family F420-dependent LLM class oxidoreductase [Actinobacteria bacterium]|nr:TIGR03617 family F420-dependent LLM class oxidoreductase [Actinomycetota bacterium]
MHVETSLATHGSLHFTTIAEQAKRAEALGFDRLTIGEIRADPFVLATVAASATSTLQVGTGVAIAFPRSPMVVAYLSQNLQTLSNGRFVLGLGTQVKAHVERRFSATWDHPGARFREYVAAVRHILDSWQTGSPVHHEGEFYSFTLMTPEFVPGPMPGGAPPIELAGLNRMNIATAGMVADGLKLHPISGPGYVRDVIWPVLREAATRAHRSLDGFRVSGGAFIATGATADEVTAAREAARERTAWYGSTKSYLPALAHGGWGDVHPPLRQLVRDQRWDELSGLVSDAMLDTFCISGTYEELPERIAAELGGIVDTISLPIPESTDADVRFGRCLDKIRAIDSGRAG